MTLLSGLGATGAVTTQSDQARAQLSGNFDTFLRLLTTQLQNQDPLEPMDSTKFTEQLVQYSQVEQQIQTNTQLKELTETLTKQIQATSAGAALSFIGRTAEFNSDLMGLGADGDAAWNYVLAPGAATVNLVVKDASGRVVYQQEGEIAPGTHEFSWVGEDLNGVRQPAGIYQLSVVAKDSDGKNIETATTVRELITGVDMSSADATVVTRSGARGFDSILRITNLDA